MQEQVIRSSQCPAVLAKGAISGIVFNHVL